MLRWQDGWRTGFIFGKNKSDTADLVFSAVAIACFAWSTRLFVPVSCAAVKVLLPGDPALPKVTAGTLLVAVTQPFVDIAMASVAVTEPSVDIAMASVTVT